MKEVWAIGLDIFKSFKMVNEQTCLGTTDLSYLLSFFHICKLNSFCLSCLLYLGSRKQNTLTEGRPLEANESCTSLICEPETQLIIDEARWLSAFSGVE